MSWVRAPSPAPRVRLHPPSISCPMPVARRLPLGQDGAAVRAEDEGAGDRRSGDLSGEGARMSTVVDSGGGRLVFASVSDVGRSRKNNEDTIGDPAILARVV